jgi:hypothetical protein
MNKSNKSNNKNINYELLFDNKKKLYYTNESILRGIMYHTFMNASKTIDPNNPYNSDGPIENLDPGVFTKNPKGWNIQKASNWVHTHAASFSMHQCAKYVRMGIEAGGLSTAGRPNWAWKYINYLPTIGFKFIDKVDNSYKGEKGPYRPEPGDIAVYTKGGNQSVPGHICMWTGAEWASDFRQKNMIVYKTTPKAYIFRFV